MNGGMRTAKRRSFGPKSARLCPLVFSIAMLFAALGTPAWADSNTPDLSQINRKLSALANQSMPATRSDIDGQADGNSVHPRALPAITVRHTEPQALGSFVPAKLLKIAQQVQGADRLMHFRSHGIDANFWGVLNRGRGVNVQYSVKF
jgi:hypothetical protein